jgi:phosphate transport system substrate-binding protein
VIPGMLDYLLEFVSGRAAGEEGYLSEKGLVPSPAAERARIHAEVRALKGAPNRS